MAVQYETYETYDTMDTYETDEVSNTKNFWNYFAKQSQDRIENFWLVTSYTFLIQGMVLKPNFELWRHIAAKKEKRFIFRLGQI